MLTTYKFRIYPTKQQINQMEMWLEECRWLYNHFLAERKNAWENEKKSLSYYTQATSLPMLKKERLPLSGIYAQVLQNVAMRVDLSFKAFFRRVKAGEAPGYPRFKGKGRYNSFTFPQTRFSINKKFLYLPKLGDIKIKQHRGMEGRIKTCSIIRSSTGKWYVCFSCEFEPQQLPKNKSSVGIDVGLYSFASFSNGKQIPNPRFFRQEEKALAKAQRKLSNAEKGSKERKKQKKVVARIHERILWKRKDFLHQESRKIIDNFDLIAVEDLRVNRMLHNHCLAKSISDAAWSGFFTMLSYKAEWAGKSFVAVNSAYTSQDCSSCGHRQKMPLSERIFHCPCCGISLDRDHNAALNILRLGTQSQGKISQEASIF